MDFPLRYRRWLVLTLAIYWIALFVGTHVPLGEVDALPQHSDKAMHFAGYAGLAFLFGLCLAATGPMSWRQYCLAFGVTAAYGVLDELLQIPLHSRTADLYDLFADWIGALVGLAAVFVLRSMLVWYLTRDRRAASTR